MRNPLYALIAFFIVEGLITTKFLSRADAQPVQDQLENVIFYAGLALGALAGLWKYLQVHMHHVNTEADLKKANLIGKTEDLFMKKKADTPSVFTAPPPLDTSGTPPLADGQPEH